MRRRLHLGRWPLARLLGVVGVVIAPVVGEAQLPVPRSAPVSLEGLVVIGNVPGVSRLAPGEVRRILRGEQSLWAGGVAVTVVLPSPRSPFIDQVARGVFGSSRAAMQRYWLGVVFQGRAAPPVQFETAEEMVAFVRRTRGAIAVVPAPVPDGAQSLIIAVP